MTYKGYTGKVTDVDFDTGELYGEVANILGVITFVAMTGPDLVREFRASVDDYLAWAAEDGFEPVKPCSGKYLAELPQSLHKSAALRAAERGISVEVLVREAVRAAVKPAVRVTKTPTKVVHKAPPTPRPKLNGKSSKPSA